MVPKWHIGEIWGPRMPMGGQKVAIGGHWVAIALSKGAIGCQMGVIGWLKGVWRRLGLLVIVFGLKGGVMVPYGGYKWQ